MGVVLNQAEQTIFSYVVLIFLIDIENCAMLFVFAAPCMCIYWVYVKNDY